MGASASVTWNECNEHLTEDEVKAILGVDFEESQFNEKKDKDTNLLSRDLLMEIVKNHEEQQVTEPKEETTTPPKIGIQLSEITKRNAKMRHRSFEDSDDHKGGRGRGGGKKRVPRAMSMEGAPSDSSNDTKPQPQGEVDCWESVQAQPSCVICGMLFATKAKLDTHIKYSSVHVDNLKKLDTLEKAKSFKGCIVDHQEEESARCRVMYSGSKYFWRTQDNLDITIYLHIDAKCIEVIAFEAKVNVEYPRLYIDETKVLSMITEDMIWKKVAAYEESEGKKKFHKELPPKDVLYAEEKRLLLSSFILQRLKLSADGTVPPLIRCISESNLAEATKELLESQSSQMLQLGVAPVLSPVSRSKVKKLFYVAEVNDTEKDVDMDLSSSKVSVTPVLISRRRHSSDQEIKDQMEMVENMQHDIQAMTIRAERIANQVHNGVENFNARVRGRNQRVGDYSKPRQRWIFAIKRVLRRALVRKARQHLLTFGDKYYTLPPGKEI